jgi:hypothetical protein
MMSGDTFGKSYGRTGAAGNLRHYDATKFAFAFHLMVSHAGCKARPIPAPAEREASVELTAQQETILHGLGLLFTSGLGT